ncbi:PREDICTED: uncharacterized protein LOC105151429 [Acromyrmex echinatior]|uniref:uncharacterized protein LOC105151429 n=1 Tax=Acromyrmex echinatior TaxID=103372 RepID=UPI000580E5FF|nr:PREDICTED: uncharacterized protein LOC105151429 [Acromyrmex echinatior]
MSGCLSSSMTGSTDAGPLQPQEEPASLPVARPSSLSENASAARRSNRHRHQSRRRMTSAPLSGQTIQLTPLWEHVVRTHRFPSEVDTQATFIEISERLRDPEWEVRQHALRVLMDVLPTLSTDVIDKVMQPVVPELINNLGHPAPAVRKGALDTLRVYLVHSPNRENMVQNILHDGLNRPDAHNPFQTNVTTGIILSAPLLLFPSSNSPPPTTQILKDATIAFASRLVQVPHQEAVLKSLMKIRDAVGEEEFESYLTDYDDKFKKNIDILSKIYNIKSTKKKQDKNRTQDIMKADKKERAFDKSWDSDSDTSGIAEEEDEIPPSRVVLETEIKFNEETAITMTILEEKDDDDSEDNEGKKNKIGNDVMNEESSSADKRRTPRRVHFGGEIVKLRTPDSDDTESIEITPKTRIPLPVSPATKMPEMMRRRPSSQPCSPHMEKRGSRRASRSASSSPKREYTHNAQLSPKKSILTKTGGPLIVINSVTPTEEMKNTKKIKKNSETILENESPRSSSQEINEILKKEDITLDQTTPASANSEDKLTIKSKDENDLSVQVAAIETSKNISLKGEQAMSLKRDGHADTIDSNRSNISEASSRQEKNYVMTKSSSPERKKTLRDKDDSFELERECLNEQKLSGNSLSRRSNSFPFGSPVNECNAQIDRLIGGDFIDDDDDDDDEQDVRTCNIITDDRAVTVVNGEGRKEWHSQYDKKEGIASEGNESVTCSSSEGEGKPQEPSWEELGLVGQEVLDDLHNKDDWRARVRGLERVASALRTSSALIAIESRLGSLLHAVLGGERSCRVAAAGLAVAKVVVAGVSEDALRKKLPQLGWGLARQGGPSAAQLARIAMLRLKPSLLLEQLLQPHCLSARNTKTRENALQLLIFSLVTFPSTEFKLEIVANRVATMVADRRRRVRQAALDTLAVLGQIYDSEEVIEAGRRAGEGNPDAEAMLAAIRARLARKSLPLVSADGLVVYGLQISPTVQTATGPDVDWIVAGRGSVSPDRKLGIYICLKLPEMSCHFRNDFLNNRESPWIERPNLVALGVGLQSKTEQSTAWQLQTNESIALRGESRIPILLSRERPKITSQNHEKSLNLEYVNSNSRKQTTDMLDSNRNRINLRQENVGSYAAIHQRRKRFQQEESQTLNQTFDSHTSSYRSSYTKALGTNREYGDTAGNSDTIFSDDNSHIYNRFVDTDQFTNENESLNYAGGRQRSLSRNMQQQTLVEAYNSILERQRKLMDRNIYRPLRTPPNPSTRLYQDLDSQNLDTQTPSDRDRNVRHRPKNHRTKDVAAAQQRTEMDLISSNSQEDRCSLSESFASPHRRRLRSLSPSQLHRSQHFVKLTSNRFHAASMYDICNTYPRSIHRVKRNAFRGHDRELLYETVDEASRDKLQVLCGMIFKFWPIEMKEENGALVGEVRPASRSGEYKIANAILFCCPCVFRCRKSVGVGRDNDGDGDGNASVSTIITTTTTPVIALRLNRNSDTINKATMVNEEEYNVRNRHHFSPDAKSYHVQNSNKEESRYQEFLRSFSIDARERPKSASSSSSDVSRNDRPGREEDQDTTLRDYNGNDNSGSSTPQSQNAGDPAFDVITQQTANRQSDTRDDVDSFFGGPPLTKSNSVIDFFAYMESLLLQRKFNRSLSFDTSFYFSTLNIMTPLDTKMEYPITTADATTVDEVLKEWNSEDDMKSASRIGSISRHSNHNELITVDENCNRSTESSSGVPEQPEDDRSSARRRSIVSALSNERILPYEDTKLFKESLQSKVTISPKRSESLYLTPNHSAHHSLISNSPIKRNSRCGSRNLIDDSKDFSEERIIASIVPDEDASIRSLDTVGHPPIDIVGDSPAIIIASRPHSHETVEYENARSVENDNPHNKINTQESTEEESSVNDALEDRQSKDSASETNMEPGILKIESEPAEDVELRRRMPSKVPVRGSSRCRMPSNKRVMEKPSEKSKRMVQQCFSQLENKDWEITMKGLKALSQISKQHPEGLDVCAAGTIGRLLGRHIKNLRSQVARAACLAASDVFSSQIRGIDQDLDDIAGPLLHRTADTNRFLRSDSNSALDQMVQYLPPHKTIGIIVLRGASHQNAIVRAATARLLSDITDRIGPDHIMILPRDVRDKLLNTGAKLLMDGNLDARNHAKRMFRRLTRCEGFRKALTDAVPETTLRHIDKTMKTL